MKKIFTILSAILIICMVSVNAAAASQVAIDKINVDSDNITFSVVLSELPEGVSEISAVTVKYSFDVNKLEYKSTSSDILVGEGLSAREGNIAWFDSDVGGANKITAEKLQNADGVLATVSFTKVSGASGDTDISFSFVELADFSANVIPSDTYTLKSGTVKLGGSSSSNGGNKDNNNGTGTGGGTTGKKTQSGGGGSVSVVTDKPVVSVPDTAPAGKGEIADIAKDNWAYQYAVSLLNKGIISGDTSDGAAVLRPTDSITREEAAKTVLLSVGVQPDSTAELTFADSDSVSDWAKGYISAAINKGVVSGYVDNTVCPKKPITREEMVTMLIKAFNWGTSDDELTFADSGKITWSKPYIAQAVALGILSGYEDNTIKPDAGITRAETFALVDRCIRLNELLTK